MYQRRVLLFNNIINIIRNLSLNIQAAMIEMAMNIIFLAKWIVDRIGTIFMYVIIRQQYFIR